MFYHVFCKKKINLLFKDIFIIKTLLLYVLSLQCIEQGRFLTLWSSANKRNLLSFCIIYYSLQIFTTLSEILLHVLKNCFVLTK